MASQSSYFLRYYFWVTAVAFIACNPLRRTMVTFDGPFEVQANGMHNVKIAYGGQVDGELSIHYGSCDLRTHEEAHHCLGKTHVGSHPLARRHLDWEDRRPTKFVWLPREDTPDAGCLHASLGNELIGQSQPITVRKPVERRSAAFADVADTMGPWFDGVIYLQQKEPDEVFVAKAKAKSIGIIGGGISGLMSSLLFESVGIHNWKILESSERLGGRVHTTYLNGTKPNQYQYQEMGPMRFPVSITDPETNTTIPILDHRMVFQLADVLNEMNGHNQEYAVNFIPWIDKSKNMPALTSKRRPDGTIPGVAEVAANPALQDNVTATYPNATVVEEAANAFNEWIGLDEDKMKSIAANVFKAHKAAVEAGNFNFSEAGYLRYVLNTDLNVTDLVDSVANNYASWEYFTNVVYFQATEWRTIDQGLNRLPTAFGPLVLNRTLFHTKVQEMSWNATTGKMSVIWRPGDLFSMEPKSMDFDYTIVSVPFSQLRLWKLPAYSTLLSRAITRLNYEELCKVALHYKTRFWEHLEHPIFGGCSQVDIPGITMICFPSYKLNSTGPGVLLASYSFAAPARSFASWTETEHVAHVQRAMVEAFGPVAQEQFTGNFDRICWGNNEHQAGAFCLPMVGQQELYIPAYFQTEKHTVFVGEHTSFTHAWVWSAVESAVRGTAQLLLDMGLVDEAKQVTQTWMARWISM
ncbi:L-amino-acid oxidase [Zopfia rhizophila CBS 207.26]|uniref:L-amino-acid oxidase n=1 Tax=Zopfia rhizophila CBS 207.26 TaxID=1314779 RepID=A0A6A6E704_9PEZI|nr:L-amino-acid oxidase [Zopfia rhizophila CBS 207.26]